MIKNNRGFMLVEVIITSVVIASAMIGFFSIFNKLYTSYNQKSKYYSVDGIYATKAAINYFLNDNFNLFINNIFDSTNYMVVMDENNCFYNNNVYKKSDFEYEKSVCKTIKDTYKVNKMIIVEYDKTVLVKEILEKETSLNQTFREYIDFVIGYYDVSDDDTRYSYLVLTEIVNGEDYYYANLGIE